MYEDVLIPFDGSDGATAVLDHAADLARWAGSTIHVLYVADTTRNSMTTVEGRAVDVLVEHGEELVAEAETRLDSLGVDVDTDVVQGNPAQVISDYAADAGYDLVVVPTSGRRGLSRYLLGSVTEKVVRLSSVPVLTARMHADERLAFPYEDVLLPTDGSPGASGAVDHGLSLAAALDARVHALSVVDDVPLGVDVRSSVAGDAEDSANEAVEDLVSTARSRGVEDVVSTVERGRPVETIRSYVDAHGIDAVVMGTTGRRGTDRILLGSVAEKTVRTAPVPVITVRHRG